MKNLSLKKIVIIGFAYLSCCVGASYAGGQENLQYFATMGLSGLYAVILQFILSLIAIIIIIGFGYESKQNPIKGTFNFYMGKYLGTIFEYLMPFFMLLIFVTMSAAAGSIFSTYFHLPHWSGVVAVVVITALTVLLDFTKMVDTLGFIGPILLVFLVAVCGYALYRTPDISAGIQFTQENDLYVANEQWWVSGIQYATMGVGGLIPFIAAMGAGANSKKEAMTGGVFGIILVLVLEVVLYFSLLANMSSIHDDALPTLSFATWLSPIVGTIFSFILLLALYTTSVTYFWTALRKIPVKSKRGKVAGALVMAIVVIVGGQLPYQMLVNTIYPIIGYSTIVIYIGIVFRGVQHIVNKKRIGEGR